MSLSTANQDLNSARVLITGDRNDVPEELSVLIDEIGYQCLTSESPAVGVADASLAPDLVILHIAESMTGRCASASCPR